MTNRIIFTAATAFIGIAALLSTGVDAEDTLPTRVAGDIRIKGDPDGLPEYAVVKAFDNLTFDRPTWVGHPGDGSDRLYVTERGGRLLMFDNKRTVKSFKVALDIRKRVSKQHNEEGLLAAAFHPDFAKTKHIYLWYSATEPRRSVLGRFTATGSRRFFNARSEKLVMRQRQPAGNHNGGALAFGPEGHLYVSVGDGGKTGDPDGNGQNVGNWLGSILRLDLNVKERFGVPADNPLKGIPNARPEIFAYGFCDVRGMSFDAVTGDLWASDAGQGMYEEINIVQRGENHGWNVREGNEPLADRKALTPLVAPIAALPRAESRRIVGGVVYRGKRLPGLAGAYVFGDHETGSVWALRWDGKQVKERKRLGRVPGVTHFGTDMHGELLMTSYDGSIYTLAPWEGKSEDALFPRRLSETGLFPDMKNLAPHPALIPFDVNVPLWSDGTGKERFIMLPGLEKVRIGRDGTYAYPDGTIFVKHFFLGGGKPGTPDRRMLETRLLVKKGESWNGYTYVWDEKQEDAHLIDGRLGMTITWDGTEREWTFPGRADCASCHTHVAGDVLGFRPEQLTGTYTLAGTEFDQRKAFEQMGLFAGKHRSSAKGWPDWRQADGDLAKQVRSYLDVNCAMCHQPDGPGNANIDLRFDTPLKKTNMLDRRPGMWDLGVYDARILAPGDPHRSMLYVRMRRTDIRGMPTIGYHQPDDEALARVAEWIKGMKKK